MKKLKSLSIVLAAVILLLTGFTFAGAIKAHAAGPQKAVVVMAGEDATAPAAAAAADNATGSKAIAAAIAIGLAALSGAMAMGIAIAKSNEGVARQPEAAGNLRSGMIIAAGMIEGAALFAIIVCLLAIVL